MTVCLNCIGKGFSRTLLHFNVFSQAYLGKITGNRVRKSGPRYEVESSRRSKASRLNNLAEVAPYMHPVWRAGLLEN
jgi:hypothetical protein